MHSIRSVIDKDTYRSAFALALTQFKLRNEGSLLGVFWYLLEPLSIFLILLSIKNVLGIEQEYYALYLFIGLVIYNYFNNASTAASRSLLGNSGIIEWIKIKLEVFPLAAAIQFVLSHIIEIVIILALMVFYNIPIYHMLFYPFLFLPVFLFTLGVCFSLSMIAVFFKDVINVWHIIGGKILWLATPIFYTIEPNSIIYSLMQWNPLYHVLELIRSVLLYGTIPITYHLFLTILFSFVSFIVGILIFTHHKHTVPERI